MLYLNNHFHGLVNISRKTCSRIWTKIRVIFNAIVLGEGFCRMQYRVSIFSKIKLKSIVGELLSAISFELKKSVNLQFNTVGRRDDDMIVPPSDGPMIIWIDWE